MNRWNRGFVHALVGVSAAALAVARVITAEASAPTALREIASVPIGQWKKGWVAFAEPVLCEGSSLYFRFTPGYTDREAAAAAAAGRTLAFGPRNVTRVSADGKTRVELDTARSPKLASAKSMVLADVAVDEHGSVFLLVWATWPGGTGQSDTYKQLIVSFDPKGEYRSALEVDADEFSAQQIQAFDSGAFALRGRRPGASQSTMAILSAGGGIKDVVRWPGRPSADDEGAIQPEHLVRGGDGRIYFTDSEARDDFVTIYALFSSGDSEPVQKLPRRLAEGRTLTGLRWSNHRFAAVYYEPSKDAGEPGREGSGRVFIAMADEGATGAPQILGPAPSSPICFQNSDSGDRFTFLSGEGKLVTMAP